MNTDIYKTFIEKLCYESAKVINPYFSNPELEIEKKEDNTPVTRADKEAEELIRRMINQEFPNHGIIGEEYGEENEDAEFVWVLDPVDGTKSFAANVPLFGTLICLKYQGQPLIGAIHQSILKQLLIGDGKSSTLNGKPVQVSNNKSLADATILTTDSRRPAIHKNGQNWEHLINQVNMFRTWGDAYGYLLTATGWADVMTDPILSEWDFVGMIPIIRGAGGIITNWEGGDPVGGNSVICGNPNLQPLVVEMLNA